mgnify:FL=1
MRLGICFLMFILYFLKNKFSTITLRDVRFLLEFLTNTQDCVIYMIKRRVLPIKFIISQPKKQTIVCKNKIY